MCQTVASHSPLGAFVVSHLAEFWRTYVLVLTPLVFLFVPLYDGSDAMRCAYVLIIMAAYWMTEPLPLPVTSLIPMFAFPLLGIMSTVRINIHL